RGRSRPAGGARRRARAARQPPRSRIPGHRSAARRGAAIPGARRRLEGRRDRRLGPRPATQLSRQRTSTEPAIDLPYPTARTAMSTSNPLLRAALVPAVTAALLLGACSKPAQPIAAPKPVRVQAVTLSAARPDDSYTGAVRARVESDLAFRVGGKVLRRLVDVGQPVRAGSVIAELDGADYELGADA